MITWVLVAVVGGILSMYGLNKFWGRYRCGEISRRYLYALIVCYVSFVLFALTSTIHPEFNSGTVSIILLPAFFAVFVLIHEYQKTIKSK